MKHILSLIQCAIEDWNRNCNNKDYYIGSEDSVIELHAEENEILIDLENGCLCLKAELIKE